MKVWLSPECIPMLVQILNRKKESLESLTLPLCHQAVEVAWTARLYWLKRICLVLGCDSRECMTNGCRSNCPMPNRCDAYLTAILLSLQNDVKASSLEELCLEYQYIPSTLVNRPSMIGLASPRIKKLVIVKRKTGLFCDRLEDKPGTIGGIVGSFLSLKSLALTSTLLTKLDATIIASGCPLFDQVELDSCTFGDSNSKAADIQENIHGVCEKLGRNLTKFSADDVLMEKAFHTLATGSPDLAYFKVNVDRTSTCAFSKHFPKISTQLTEWSIRVTDRKAWPDVNRTFLVAAGLNEAQVEHMNLHVLLSERDFPSFMKNMEVLLQSMGCVLRTFKVEIDTRRKYSNTSCRYSRYLAQLLDACAQHGQRLRRICIGFPCGDLRPLVPSSEDVYLSGEEDLRMGQYNSSSGWSSYGSAKRRYHKVAPEDSLRVIAALDRLRASLGHQVDLSSMKMELGRHAVEFDDEGRPIKRIKWTMMGPQSESDEHDESDESF